MVRSIRQEVKRISSTVHSQLELARNSAVCLNGEAGPVPHGEQGPLLRSYNGSIVIVTDPALQATVSRNPRRIGITSLGRAGGSLAGTGDLPALPVSGVRRKQFNRASAAI